MWLRKRVLKKEKKQLTKKRILLLSLGSGLTGLLLIGVGVIVLSKEPIFTSPLPLFRSFGASSEKDESKAMIDKFIKNESIDAKEVKQLNKKTYQITLNDKSEIVLTSEKDISEQLTSLQRILSRLTMEGNKFKRLDLRYDKPVIVLQ